MASSTSVKSPMNSSHPVFVPEDPALFLPRVAFDEHVHGLLASSKLAGDTGIETPTEDMQLDLLNRVGVPDAKSGGHPFMDALHSFGPTATKDVETAQLESQNLMFTENKGIAFRSTNDARLDLFTELEKTITGPRLQHLLRASWEISPTDTLKIIWNARSIHLGKGERASFYKCLGWLRQNGHVETVLANLQWLFRAVIEKKSAETDGEEQPVVVEREERAETDAKHDVPDGVAHGYMKDVLNILVLEVRGEFNVLGDLRETLYTPKQSSGKSKGNRESKAKQRVNKKRHGETQRTGQRDSDRPALQGTSEERARALAEYNRERSQPRKLEAKEKRQIAGAERHSRFMTRFEDEKDPFYRMLHLTIARLFAELLTRDMELLKSGKKANINRVSMASKWAPSLENLHDKYTFIASSIAEILYPPKSIGQEGDSRDDYLKRAREHYRRFTLSPLRKVLEVVERDISAKTFGNFDYQRIPSLAMDKYKDLFATKDFDRFEKYIDEVVSGRSRISGAVLMPTNLVKQVKDMPYLLDVDGDRAVTSQLSASKMMKKKMNSIKGKVLDGQWNSLVQRIKDSGKLEDSIAVCDVSGSMEMNNHPDGTRPIHSSIGLSLLLAEITKPPFGGSLISFSAVPSVQKVGGPSDKRTFVEKVRYIERAAMGVNTNVVAVFEKLILPMAIENQLKQEDMVKQVFVFSDMQFDEAESHSRGAGSWQTDYKRIEKLYEKSGYDMPRLIFWNLGIGARNSLFCPPPKPVTKDVAGAAVVSGYSQGQMKMFLDEGTFADADVTMEDKGGDDGEDDDGDVFVEVKKGEKGKDPLQTLMKAIGHQSYEMLKVVD